MKKAILFGASGFIGRYLLDELLSNPLYELVTIVVRKNLQIDHPKLKTLIGDYHTLPGLEKDIVADDIFITLGTTKKTTPDKDEYYQVDHDYPVLAAKMAKENGARAVFIVTAVGPDKNSTIFYLKTKWETERDILALDFEHTNIFRPSMIMGTRKEQRSLEKILIGIWRVITPVFMGKLNRFKGIEGKDIAKAINNAAKHQSEKVRIYHWKEMNELCRANSSKP